VSDISKNNDLLKVGLLIARLQRFHRRFMNAQLSEMDLSGAMHSIITTLNRSPGVSQDYLASHFNMDKGIIARQCKALEERNLIRREVNTMDRRQYCLFLTEEGEATVPKILDCYRGWVATICRDLTDEQASAALSLLTTMVDSCLSDLGELL